MATASMSKRRQKGGDETGVRERILKAAFAAFMKSGYATTSTLEIATRARVSKRELYRLVGNKVPRSILNSPMFITARSVKTGAPLKFETGSKTPSWDNVSRNY
jgi:Bacterial regulatory proteins, tetR family